MEKGQIVSTSGSSGIILDVFANDVGKRVFTIYFVKNAMRHQPPETQLEENLPGLRIAQKDELISEIAYHKSIINHDISTLMASIPPAPEPA